jgi:hypothetical protein
VTRIAKNVIAIAEAKQFINGNYLPMVQLE